MQRLVYKLTNLKLEVICWEKEKKEIDRSLNEIEIAIQSLDGELDGYYFWEERKRSLVDLGNLKQQLLTQK